MNSSSTRKGISPLIAAVLLIAFTMAVAAILTAFVTTYTRDTTSAVGNTSERLIDCSQARLEILSGKFNASQATGTLWLNITVENQAQGNLTGFTISTFDTNDDFIGSSSHDSLTIGGADIEVFNLTDSDISRDFALQEVRIRNQRCSETAKDTFSDLTNNSESFQN